MKNLLTVLLLFVLPGVAVAEDRVLTDADLGRVIAERYGFAEWGEVESLEFTFNVELPDREVARAWTWDVAEEAVTRRSPGEPVTIDLGGDPVAWTPAQTQVHKQFINDSYWLLFPFQLVWSDPSVTDAGMAPLPAGTEAGSGEGRKVVAQWPAEGGYTPGDAYDLFLDGDGVIRAWIFRRDGNAFGRSVTFAGYEQVGPLLLSLDHQGDGGFRLFFTDVDLTLRTGERASATGPR